MSEKTTQRKESSLTQSKAQAIASSIRGFFARRGTELGVLSIYLICLYAVVGGFFLALLQIAYAVRKDNYLSGGNLRLGDAPAYESQGPLPWVSAHAAFLATRGSSTP